MGGGRAAPATPQTPPVDRDATDARAQDPQPREHEEHEEQERADYGVDEAPTNPETTPNHRAHPPLVRPMNRHAHATPRRTGLRPPGSCAAGSPPPAPTAPVMKIMRTTADDDGRQRPSPLTPESRR